MRAAGIVAVLAFASALAATPRAAINAAAQAQAGQQAQPTFRSSTSAVTVDVNVRDRSRRPVKNLQASDFVVLDNGVQQDVDDVSFGKLPVDVTIGLDVSYSVTGPVLDRLRRAVVQLMGDLGKSDRLKLMLFNMRANRSVDFTTDVASVERAIRTAAAGGGTALFDTISVALVSASSLDRRQLIVFFTDGADSSSTTTPAILTSVAERTQATLTFVMPPSLSGLAVASAAPAAVNRPGVSGSLMLNQTLIRLAADTGGSVLPVNPTSDFGTTFKLILDDFRSTYVLYFSPKGVERTGFHTISVQVQRPDVVVQARRGYFGG